MPLDPSIILRGRGVEVEPIDVGRTLAQVAQIQRARQQLTLGELGMAQARREQAQEDELRQLLRETISTNGVPDAQDLMARSVSTGNLKGLALAQGLQKQGLEQQKQGLELFKLRGEIQGQPVEQAKTTAMARKEAAQARKAEVEALSQVNTLVYQAASSVTDQATYDRALGYLEQTLPEPYRTQILRETPPTYDPAYVAQVQQMTRSSGEQLQEELKRLELQTAQANRLAGGQVIEGEGGFAVANPLSGVVRPLLDATGQPLKGKPTEAQSAALGFGTQAQQAHAIAAQLEAQGLAAPGLLAKGVLGTPFGNYLVSEDRQLYEQAQRNFIGAVLRKESGAAISPTELENERKRYFPQPGDTQAVIEQKRRARETTIKNLERQAGRSLASTTATPGAERSSGRSPAPRIASPYGHLAPEQLTPAQRAEEKAWLQQQLSGGR